MNTYPGNSLNKFSKTVQDYLDKGRPKSGQIVKYRLLNGTKNIDPDPAKKGEMLFPSVTTIRMNGSINDPGFKDEEGKVITEGGPAQFGIVKSFDDKKNQFVFQKFFVRPVKGDGGIFMIRQNVASEMENYEGLELSNNNKSNPFRDPTEEVLFERIDDTKEASARSSKRNYLLDSWNAIKSWDADELKFAAAGFNINTDQDAEVLKDALQDVAQLDPEKFYKAIDSPDMQIKAMIKLSLQAEIISFNAFENKYVLTGSDQTLATLDRKEGAVPVDQFCEFIKTATNGPAVRTQLEKLLKTYNKKSIR